MFNHILVPLDGSDLAAGILPHVRTMAAVFDARVTLLLVSDATAEPDVNLFSRQLRHAEAEAYLREQRHNLSQGGLQVDSDLLEGPAAERIVAYAEQEEVDLIVLSSHGRGGLDMWHISHVAQKVLQRGTTSIMLVRAAHARPGPAHEGGYRRIVVPLDGSQRAECVLPIVDALAHHEQAQLLLVHVTTQPFIFNRLPPTAVEAAAVQWLIAHNQAGARTYLQELASRLTAVAETALPVSDNTMLALHEVVAQEAADLVVFSAHGYSGQSQWPYGNVVSNFIAHGSAPLLIVQDLPQTPASEQLDSPQREALSGSPERVAVELVQAPVSS